MSTMVEERAPIFVGDLRKMAVGVYAGSKEVFYLDAIQYRGENNWIWITNNHMGVHGGWARWLVIENEVYRVLEHRTGCWYRVEKVEQ